MHCDMQVIAASTDFGQDDGTYCQVKVQSSSVVTFQLVTDEVTIIRKSAKLTFNGALANLGINRSY